LTGSRPTSGSAGLAPLAALGFTSSPGRPFLQVRATAKKDYIGMRTIAKSLFNKIEYRTSEKEGKRIIEALIPYNSKSVDLGGFKEIITETAFRKTLNDGANVYAYYNHDDGKVLGSTASGTLELRNEKDGLYCQLLLGNTSYANDVWDIISRKDCTSLSFGFIPHDVENRGSLRYLRSVQLKEISFCVTQPAYEAANSVAYTRAKGKKDYIGMKNLITRSINTELLEEIISSGKLIEDEEAAKEILSLISPDLLKKLTAVEPDPAEAADRNDTEEEEKEKQAEEDEKKKLLEQLEAELQSELKETEEEEEKEEEEKE
jgi:HK97 family phage prohead protease